MGSDHRLEVYNNHSVNFDQGPNCDPSVKIDRSGDLSTRFLHTTVPQSSSYSWEGTKSPGCPGSADGLCPPPPPVSVEQAVLRVQHLGETPVFSQVGL